MTDRSPPQHEETPSIVDGTEDVDRLYGLPLGEFTAARDDLARELRDGGERDAAKQVKALRRPTVAAWTVNQLVRSHRDEIGKLLALRDDLQEAQRSALSGAGAEELRGIGERRRRLIDDLLDRAEGVLSEGGHAVTRSTLDRIEDTLMAATVDEGSGGAVGEARLERELPAPSGFEQLTGMAAAPAPKASAQDRKARDARRASEEARAGEEAAERADEEARRLEREAERSRKEAERARRKADRASERARELRARAEELARP